MSKRDRYDSDDNRYFYEHYEGKAYNEFLEEKYNL